MANWDGIWIGVSGVLAGVPYYKFPIDGQTAISDAISYAENTAPKPPDYTTGDKLYLQLRRAQDDSEGTTTDAAVSAGATGTKQAKLRAISRDAGAILALLPTALSNNNLRVSLAEQLIIQRTELALKGSSTPLVTNNTDEQGVAALANNRLFGLIISETANTTASLRGYNGTSTSDPLIIPLISLSAYGYQVILFGDRGIDIAAGLYIERISGDTEMVFFTGVIA